MIEAPGPVNLSLHLLHPQWRSQLMDHAPARLILIDGIHVDAGKRSQVERLAAGCGIKRGSVKNDPVGFRVVLNHTRFKDLQVGVGVVKAFGHSIAIVTRLLEPSSVLSVTGTLSPLGALAGIVTLIWNSPTKFGVRPANRGVT